MKKLSEYTKDKRLNRIINEVVNKALNRVLNEGVDFDPETKTVSYNPSHEDNVDTSLENNPTSNGSGDRSVTLFVVHMVLAGHVPVP